jgi:hypothetical protein
MQRDRAKRNYEDYISLKKIFKPGHIKAQENYEKNVVNRRLQ